MDHQNGRHGRTNPIAELLFLQRFSPYLVEDEVEDSKRKNERGNSRISVSHHQIIKLTLSILLIPFLGFLSSTQSAGQQIGKQAEMDRLEQQADNLAAQADPEGAAIAIGKAAMMAKIIAQQQGEAPVRSLFESGETFFRGQEYAYRALAIFEQTGGQPPAPHGVCHFLEQAADFMTESKGLLAEFMTVDPYEESRQQRYSSQIIEWQTILQELKHDLAC